MSLQALNFHNLGGVVEDDQKSKEAKFEKYGAFHKTNIVFMLDMTSEMMSESFLEEKDHGKVPLAYACLLAIRAAIIDMIKHSSLGGGGRDRVALLGLLHDRTVVLLDLQLPSAKTLETIDDLRKTLRKSRKLEGKHIDLARAFDIAFTFLSGLEGDAQIFICTVNDDPCDKTKKQRGVSEEQLVRSKAADLTRNHDVSIKLLAVPRSDDDEDDGDEDSFDMTKFWQHVVSESGSGERLVLESLSDLAQNIKALTRPTAITVPSGSKLKLRMPCAPGDIRDKLVMHVNLYALSRSRDFDPSKSFKVDVDDGHFLTEAKVRDGKILHPSPDTFEGRLDGASSNDADGEKDLDAPGEDPYEPKVTEGLYKKLRVLQFLDNDLKHWTLDELKGVIEHDNPRTVDILGFIPQNAVNTEFRGQSPQYMTLVKGSDSEAEEWWTSLWHCCRKLDVACLALLYLRETNSPKQILLSAHPAHFDQYGSMRLPSGFYIHYLPFRDRIYVEVRPPISEEKPKPDVTAMETIEACLNHVSKKFVPVKNKKSERQWKVLEALALDKAPPDFTVPKPNYPKEITGHLKTLKALCGSEAVGPTAKKPRRGK
ncbi:uncharacterized protein LOC100901491 [Galendromus occidentalis]|uniref:Uncharacterized protein LOC100901491 n=1 Tax=Galendromus occidentalis TaxID=34638 RepID=A0AAJ7L3L5_9ACAR|nr:uncharacterized protein LOC100901491 [Galendromus occidentalis]